MEALPRTYKGPKGFVQVSPLGMVSSVVYTDLPEFVRNQPELYRPHRARDQCTRVYGVRGIWKVVPPDLYLLSLLTPVKSDILIFWFTLFIYINNVNQKIKMSDFTGVNKDKR